MVRCKHVGDISGLTHWPVNLKSSQQTYQRWEGQKSSQHQKYSPLNSFEQDPETHMRDELSNLNSQSSEEVCHENQSNNSTVKGQSSTSTKLVQRQIFAF